MAKLLFKFSVPTIAKGCALFGKKPVMRGCRPAAGVNLFGPVTLWFPQIKNDYWTNIPTSGYDKIFESPKDLSKNNGQIKTYLNKGEIRVTFVKDLNSSPNANYEYKGIYKLNQDETMKMKQCVWERVCIDCDTDENVLKDILMNKKLIK